jgi:hypothetical protein
MAWRQHVSRSCIELLYLLPRSTGQDIRIPHGLTTGQNQAEEAESAGLRQSGAVNV